MKAIAPTNNNGSIQLKFSVKGKRYSFNPVPGGDYGNKRDMDIAQSIAVKIQNDVLAGVFDPTLDRYRPNPSQEKKLTCNLPQKSKGKNTQLLTVWDAWVETLDLSPATKADHYEMVRRMLLKASPTISEAEWFTTAQIAPSTFNKRLGYLKSCFKWAIAQNLVSSNPFEGVKSRKAAKPQVKPFTEDEMKAIITEFDCKYPHYVPFVTFLFMTGVRTGEAIGLQWKHINFARSEIAICESLSKDRAGNGYRKVRKNTKTGSVRYLAMSSDLRKLLEGLKPGKPDELVFKSAWGYVIDAGNFREDWKKVLTNLSIPYRKPYTARHTLLSHAIEQGIPITGVAYLAGHADTRMVMQTYGHMINRPSLPSMNLLPG